MKSPILAASLAGNVIGSQDSSFVVAEWRDAGGGEEPPLLIAPLHLHRSDDELWYVLEGVLCVQLGDEVIEARAGAAVMAPAGTPHTFWNPSPDPTRYLLVMTPRVHRLIEEIHMLEDRSWQSLQALFEKYDSQLF
ncbi:MAG TPA: cupin domain-containing protein [Fimbriimonas sp.]|nr:cupin domain-containing protein [Fimbriimonas sp.]